MGKTPKIAAKSLKYYPRNRYKLAPKTLTLAAKTYILLYEFASNFSNFASIFYRIRGKISTFSRLFLVMIVTIWCLIYDENAEFIAQAMECNYEGVDELVERTRS